MPYNDRHWRDRDNNIRVIDDEKKQALLLDTFNFDVPTAGIFDTPYRCYVINNDWAKLVLGFVSWMATVAVWKDADDDDHAGIQGILDFLSQDGICMGLFQLRQSTVDNCILEQSIDGGQNWTMAFDYSLCVSPAIASQSLNDSIVLLDSLNTAYDGTVVSVAPDMVYDGGANDNLRDDALCHALTQLVDFMCESELEYRRQLALFRAITLIIMAIIGAIITVATLGTAIPIYLAISASLAGGFGVLFGGLSEAIITDETAKDAVVCCMRDALFGATITQTNFETSLDNCAFTGGTNEDQLAGAIAQLLTQSDMYVSFLDYLQRAYKLAELGIASCDCDALFWEHTFDFTTASFASDGWGQVSWGDGWVSGGGWRSKANGTAQELNYLEIVPASNITIISIETKITNRIGSQSNYGSAGWNPNINVNTYILGVNTQRYYENLNGNPTTKVYAIYDGAPITIDRILIQANPLLSDPDKFDYEYVTLKGTGVNPFV